MILSYTVSRTELLKYSLRRELQVSSTLLKRLKYADAVLVNGTAQHVDYRLVPGDHVSVDLDMAEPPAGAPAEPGELTVLYEDDALLAVSKPSGMLTHPSPARSDGTLLGRVLAHTKFAHVVNRLDRDTTGIVLFAKNAYVQDRVRIVEKVYTALAWGRFAEQKGTIDLPIGRAADEPGEEPKLPTMKRIVGEGQRAVTHYEVLDEWMLGGEICSLLRLCPETGRTHQLRVHCASLGHPLLGDGLYGHTESLTLSRLLGLSGQLLHAGRLTVRHPIDGRIVSVECADHFVCRVGKDL